MLTHSIPSFNYLNVSSRILRHVYKKGSAKIVSRKETPSGIDQDLIVELKRGFLVQDGVFTIFLW